jgi:hypothetical protein
MTWIIVGSLLSGDVDHGNREGTHTTLDQPGSAL